MAAIVTQDNPGAYLGERLLSIISLDKADQVYYALRQMRQTIVDAARPGALDRDRAHLVFTLEIRDGKTEMQAMNAECELVRVP